MNTSDGQQPKPETPSLPANIKPLSDVLARGDASPPLPVDESAAALEARLQKETDGRNEDRFYAFAFGTVLFDAAIFPHTSAVGILCIFVLEVIILLGLARRLGNEHVTILLDYLYHKLCDRIGLGKD